MPRPNTAELPRDTFARARAVAAFRGEMIDIAPRPVPRRPAITIGPGFWLAFSVVLWAASVLFAGWTIARVWPL